MISVNGIAVEYGYSGRVTSPTIGVLFAITGNPIKSPYLWG